MPALTEAGPLTTPRRPSVLAGWLARRLGRHDRGAVAVTVAILLAGGTLLGFAALAVDVGVIYSEREQLQSGADAAALGLANACSRGRDECDDNDSRLAFAKSLASANADDNAADAYYVCGRDSRGWLAGCSGHEPNNLTRCVGARPTSGYYVEVHVRTLNADGSTLLPPVFAQAVAGGPSTGPRVGACARASWQEGSSTTTAAFAISICAYSASKTDDADDNPAKHHENGFSTEHTFRYNARSTPLHDLAAECRSSPPTTGRIRWNNPPDFAWLATTGAGCTPSITNGRVYDNGITSWPTACRPFIRAVQPHTTPLTRFNVPVIDGMRTIGGRTQYHVAFYQVFTVTGFYRTSRDNAGSWLGSPANPCAFRFGSDRCIAGVYYKKPTRNPSPVTNGVVAGIALTG